MNSPITERIGGRLRAAERILLTSHIRPDGDAVGSVLGLGLSLQAEGRAVQMVLADGIPSNLRFLPGSEQIQKQVVGPVDLIVVLDSSDLQRTGSALAGLPTPDINIDHHITNLNFAELNLVEPETVATCAVLARHLGAWGLPLTTQVAQALLAGLITDTIGFRTSNMNPEALRIGAALMEQGANLPQIYEQALSRRTFPATRYWGAGLTRLQRDGRLVWTSLTLADREFSGYSGNDDADLVNILSAIQEGDVAVIFIEQRGGHVKVSWRAQPGYDVSQIALAFGGGGHPAAAGADIAGTLADVQQRVLAETAKILQNGQQAG